jgi:hypothetical protein
MHDSCLMQSNVLLIVCRRPHNTVDYLFVSRKMMATSLLLMVCLGSFSEGFFIRSTSSLTTKSSGLLLFQMAKKGEKATQEVRKIAAGARFIIILVQRSI